MQNSTIHAFFTLVQAGLWEKEARLSPVERVNYSKIMNLAEEQSVIGLVTAGLENVVDVQVPKEELLQFIGQTLQLEQQNNAMNKYIAFLVERMRKADIYSLLVKGQGIAQCYEKPLWRTCGDVDLFLSEENYHKAKTYLVPLATTAENEYAREKHLGLIIDRWLVELHGHLYCGLSRRIERQLDKVYKDTFYGGSVRSWNNNGVQVFLLKAENDVFYVFTHILQHFYKEGVGLRQICDWCRLLWTFRVSLNRDFLESYICKAGLMSEWKAFGAFAIEYLGMPVEAMPFYNEFDSKNANLKKKAERIMDFILMSGNFGHNRDKSYFSKYPFVIRKCCSMWMRVSDLYNHARIFPMDSLKFFPRIMWNGMLSAVRGEG